VRTPEGNEKKAVKKYLTDIGAFHRWPVPYGYGQPHVDCYACVAGQFWAIEVKAEGENATALQRRTLQEAEAAGAFWVCGVAVVIIDRIETWRKRKVFGGPIA